MSFYTSVQLFHLEGSFDLEDLSPKISDLVRSRHLHEDVASDFVELLDGGKAGFALESASIMEMLKQIASWAPSVIFAVRGQGEDPRTIWVREYESGEETFAFGPPEGGEY